MSKGKIVTSAETYRDGYLVRKETPFGELFYYVDMDEVYERCSVDTADGIEHALTQLETLCEEAGITMSQV